MNNLEALENLYFSSIDEYSYEDRNEPNLNETIWYKQVKEFSENKKHYRWHDLRNSPNDLPKEIDWVLALFKEPDTDFILVPRVAEYIGKSTPITTREKWIIRGIEDNIEPYYANLVCIAWKYIEEFEDE